MENKEYDIYLKKLEAIHAKNFKDDKSYLEGCRANKDLNPRDYKIDYDHKLDEYFDRYGNKLLEGKLLAFKKDELWLMNKDTTYWKLDNDSDFVYFALPYINKKAILFPLLSFIVAGAIASGITAGVLLLNKGANAGGGEGGGDDPASTYKLKFLKEDRTFIIGTDTESSGPPGVTMKLYFGDSADNETGANFQLTNGPAIYSSINMYGTFTGDTYTYFDILKSYNGALILDGFKMGGNNINIPKLKFDLSVISRSSTDTSSGFINFTLRSSSPLDLSSLSEITDDIIIGTVDIMSAVS